MILLAVALDVARADMNCFLEGFDQVAERQAEAMFLGAGRSGMLQSRRWC